MINCIVIDDEPLAQDVLVHYIDRSPKLRLIKKCHNALEAFNVLHAESIDLMFVDIKMPGINGLDFVRSLKHPPAVIFTTAFAEHALTGFELDAVDYLLKPITHERFEKSINKLLKIHQAEAAEAKPYTYFKVSGKLVKVMHCDILYAQSVKDYILLYTKQGNHLTHMTMKYLNQLLPADTFIRVHRSYLVNKDAVSQINKNDLKIGTQVIPLSLNYRGNINRIN